MWKWGASSLPAPFRDDPILAGGILLREADPEGDGWYAIWKALGYRNEARILDLYPAGKWIPGNAPFTGDNLLRLSDGQGGTPQLSQNGFQFALTGGTDSNIFYAAFLSAPAYLEFHSMPPFPDGPLPVNREEAVAFQALPSGLPDWKLLEDDRLRANLFPGF